MTMEKALLIEFDLRTGERAGGISPKDSNLPCRGWQNLESEPALEIRLVKDGRDLSQYEGVKGITVLEGKEAINNAIKANIPTQYGIQDMDLLIAHMKEKGLSLDMLKGKNRKEMAEDLYKQGLAGINKREPRLLS